VPKENVDEKAVNKTLNEKESIISYWIKMSDNDFDTMIDLFKAKRYNWSLFIGHLVIEKLLKAYFVKSYAQHPPLIHDLLKLALKSNLELSEKQMLILDTITTFNINARYDDYKLAFFKKCTKAYTTQWVKNITEFRQWIKEEHLK
jgi:HEPN domain-containing protein